MNKEFEALMQTQFAFDTNQLEIDQDFNVYKNVQVRAYYRVWEAANKSAQSKLNIDRATLLVGDDTDKVDLYTTSSLATPDGVTHQVLSTYVKKGKGSAYLEDVLGIKECQVIKLPTEDSVPEKQWKYGDWS